MRVLALIHRLPCPPDRGAKLRAAAELDWLTRRHEVWCAGFIDPPGPDEDRTALAAGLDLLRARCQELLAVPWSVSWAKLKGAAQLLIGGTATEGCFGSAPLRRTVLEWSRQRPFDAVLAFSSSMAPLALDVPARRRVLDLVDLDSQKWAESEDTAGWPMRWVYRTEARRLRGREREWIQRFDASVLCTPREAALIDEPMLRQRVHVIETGAASRADDAAAADRIDQQYVAPTAASLLPVEPVIGFIGAMDYGPNVEAVRWFAAEIWPEVLRARPDARWWIVGRSPVRAVRELADGERIRVTGTVPTVEPLLAGMRVSVAPLKLARGLQTKVLTAMEAGRPCVVTSCVAEGLGAEPDREILVADEPAAFARKVIELLDDSARSAALGRAGRRFVQRRYRAAEGLERLETLLRGDSPTGGLS